MYSFYSEDPHNAQGLNVLDWLLKKKKKKKSPKSLMLPNSVFFSYPLDSGDG